MDMSHNEDPAISTPQQFSVLLDELASSAWTLAAIGVLFDSGPGRPAARAHDPWTTLAAGCPTLSRERIERCLAVAVLRGVVTVEPGRYRLAPGVLPALEPGAAGGAPGRATAPTCCSRPPTCGPPASRRAPAGWHHTDPLILQAQGDGSSMFARRARRRT